MPENQPESGTRTCSVHDTSAPCTWSNYKPKFGESHVHEKYPREVPKILPNILYHVGNTPLVRLNRIGKEEGLECELLVKCEYFNAGGSVKDRICLRMIEEAERSGQLKPGMTLIEPTSGNTGIGIALVAAIKGYRCIVVMPEKNSQEKMNTLKALGAEIVRTPTSAPHDSPESYVNVAARLQKQISGSLILGQFENMANPLAHYDQTAEEILDQCDGKVDMIVAGTGTGGTLTGIGRKLKERCPSCLVVGVDPIGSLLAEPGHLNQSDSHSYEVEGIGGDFVPPVLDRGLIDFWIKSCDQDSFVMARRLIKEEGLLCGGSSGSNVWAAVQAAKKLKAGQKCVVILPDGVRNYMTKFPNDHWMAERGFIDIESELANKFWWWNLDISQLKLHAPITIWPTVTIQEAIDIMEKEGFHQLPVVAQDGTITGVVTQGSLMSNLLANKVTPETPVENILYKQFQKINLYTNMGKLSRILDTDHFAIVVHDQKQFIGSGHTANKEVIVGIITRIDLLNFVITHEKNGHQNGTLHGDS